MVDQLSYPVQGDHHLSDDWNDHISRGSLGGVDFPVAYGTPVYADHDGFLAVDASPAGSGGRVATIQGGGITTQCLHMSDFVRGNGNVSRGELIGHSGASAYGSNYGTGGPHVHWHAIVNGVRVNPLNYLGSDAAGGNATPIHVKTPEELEEEELMAAKDEIMKAIENSTREVKMSAELGRPLKLVAVIIPEAGFNGWLWVDQEGDWAVCPGDAYAKLVAAWGFSQPSPIREVRSKAEWEYMTGQLLGTLNNAAKSSEVRSAALKRAVDVASMPESQVNGLLAK